MPRPRFLADEDLRGSIVRGLRRRAPKIELTTVIEAGLASIPDDEVLDFAWQHHWLVVSHDVNTIKAIAEGRIASGDGIHGLFLVPQRSGIREILESLHLIWEASQFEEWRDRIIFLPL
jgi:hypothetical protein